MICVMICVIVKVIRNAGMYTVWIKSIEKQVKVLEMYLKSLFLLINSLENYEILRIRYEKRRIRRFLFTHVICSWRVINNLPSFCRSHG